MLRLKTTISKSTIRGSGFVARYFNCEQINLFEGLNCKQKKSGISLLVKFWNGGEMAAQLSDEDQLKFEAELSWCLEQLQASLSSGKLSQKQGE